MTIRRSIRWSIAVLVSHLVMAAPIAAQSMSSFAAGAPSATKADADDMMRTAIESVRSRGRQLIDDQRGSADASPQSHPEAEELTQLLEQRVHELEDAVQRELEPLRMDGFLGRSEVSRAIARVTESAWLSFEEAAHARRGGHPIPPRPSEFEDSYEYTWEMVKYTVARRNGAMEYVVLLAAVVAGILVAWLCSRLLTMLQSSFKDHEYDVLGSLVNGVRGPLYVTLALAGVSIGLRRFWLPRATEEVLWVSVKLAFVAALLWLSWSVVSLLAQGLGWMLKTTYREPDKQSVALIRKSLHLVVLLVFAFVVTEMVFGVELQSLLIGVGLFGLALTLAAQDSLKNLFGSLTIVIDRPFRVGDLVEFKGFFGTVEDIGFRSTRLRELDGHLVTIPNADIVREPVQNIDARPWIRRRFRIGLRYDTSPEKVQEAIDILEDVLGQREDKPEEMSTHAVLERFGESNLMLLVQYCVTPGEYWDALKRGSELHLDILRRFNEAKIDFAYPTHTSVIETDPDRPPILTGAGDKRESA